MALTVVLSILIVFGMVAAGLLPYALIGVIDLAPIFVWFAGT